MNVELPAGTIEFVTVLAQALKDDRDSTGLFSLLDGLGVLDLAAPDSADPDNAHVNIVAALEEIARAGVCAPVAETIWSRGAVLDAPAGFVAIASAGESRGDRLIPYGALATSLVCGTVAAPEAYSMPGEVRPAHVEIDSDHLWLPNTISAPSFVELDQAYAWRSAAATTVGAMAKATDMAIGHARDRVQFGKPLASFQSLQFRLAESHWRLMGLRLLVREAAWRADCDEPRADAVSALAWLYARTVGKIVTKHTHQIHGAIGFTRELGLTTVTGSTATLRSLYPARDAAEVVRSARGWSGDVPPSTVLGGFRP
jgi:alkylation response protein AidB-like acyl-CoA dehydrogenase